MTKDEVLKLALEAFDDRSSLMKWQKAREAIREALAQPEHSCVACDGNPKGNNNPCAVCGLAQPEQEPVAWLITDENINSIQIASIQHLIDRARHAHMTDIKLRINRQDEWHQADWLKHLTRTTPPSNSMNSIKSSNTLDTHRKPLSNQKIIEMYNEPRSDAEMIEFARAIEAAHGIWFENSDCYGPDWTDRDGEYLK